MNEFCFDSIDYTTVSGSRILPFIITLDTALSVLDPEEGQNQRFCYTITGVGEDSSLYADLSHIVFGVCSDISYDDLSDVSVVIDGVSRTVEIGENVELIDPDPPTGCSGLKFDFGLGKVSGVMSVCFSLGRAFEIGPVPVCLFGGGQTAAGLSVCGPVCANSCPSNASVLATVCVPVTVTPYASVGTPATTCCGLPQVSSGEAQCIGTPSGTCTFTISQDICVSVPVSFAARATVGEGSVLCRSTSADSCQACSQE